MLYHLGYTVNVIYIYIYIIYFAKHESQHDLHMQFNSQYYKKW